jgi:hypothetical protein
VSYIGLEQFDLRTCQAEQGIHLFVDFSLAFGDLGAEAQDFGFVTLDPCFPSRAFGQFDIGLEVLFDLGTEGSEVGKQPPVLELGVESGCTTRWAQIGDTAAQAVLQGIAGLCLGLSVSIAE